MIAGIAAAAWRKARNKLTEFGVHKLDTHTLESFYTELRRCRMRCDRKPFIERHATDEEHDCVTAQCAPHTCKPLAASTVRQIHSIISGTLSAVERWGWIEASPARVARRPRPKPPEPDPPTPAKPPGSPTRHSARA
jgi:integrase